jgi:Outer membrane protein beta-barrel domain
MSENLHDIDKLFRDSIEAHEEMPDGKVWDAIDNNLDKSNVIQIKRKYNNLKRLAVALLLLLLGTIAYEIQSKKSGKEELVKNNSDGNNKINNTAAKNTKQKEGVNNLNDSGNAEDTLTKTSSTFLQSTELNNAGKAPLVDTVQHSGENTNQRTGIIAIQNNKAKISASYSSKEAITGEDSLLGQVSKYGIKKLATHKTKITVINAATEQAVTIDEYGAVKNARDKLVVSIGLNELKPLLTYEAEKIAVGWPKNNLTKINAIRTAPDAISGIAGVKNKNARNRKAFHFSITAFYSPQFSSNNIREEAHTQNNGPGGPPPPPPGGSRDQIKKEEQHQNAFSTGVLVDIPLGKNWSIQSGITYINKNISIEPKKIYARLDKDGKAKYLFDCSSGYTYISSKTGSVPAIGDSINATNSTNLLGYLGIPLGLNYAFSTGKFNIIPAAGITSNFLVKQGIKTELTQGVTKEKQVISTIQGLKSTYFNAFAGVALEYNVSKRIALNITPSGNFALSSINKDAAVKSYPNSFALAGGIKIKL